LIKINARALFSGPKSNIRRILPEHRDGLTTFGVLQGYPCRAAAACSGTPSMEDEMIDLLSRRILTEGLDKKELASCEPAILKILQEVCATCEYREECELGLADDFADLAWDAYCPNAVTFKALGELPWFRLASGP
jgi:hypothetical protein